MQLLVYSITLGASLLAFVFSIVALQSTSWIKFQTPPDSPFQYSSNYGLFERCDRSNLFPDYRCRPFPRRSTDCADPDALRLATIGFGFDGDGFVTPVWPAANASSSVSSTQAAPISPLVFSFPHTVLDGMATRRKGKRSSIMTQEQKEKARTMTQADFEAQGDQQFGFCELWHTGGYSAQISLIIGVAGLITLLVVLVGNTQRKANGWRLVAGLILVHAAFQILTFGIMFHLFATDSRFYIGSRLGPGTFFNVAAWAIDVVVVVALTAAALAGAVDVEENDEERSGYEPIRD